MNISKELLSEVLNIENERISRTVDKFCFPNTNTIAVQYYMTDGWQHINIYELAHKCKEWAIKKGYQFKVYYQADGAEEWEIGLAGYGWDLLRVKNCVEACEWILSNK